MNQILLVLLILLIGGPAAALADPPAKKKQGVWFDEVTINFPQPIVQIPTAIPAFIGMTANLLQGPAAFRKVTSLADYESIFGKDAGKNAYLYASIRLFYANGGGEARVYSLGTNFASLTKKGFLDALTALSKEVGPTLILFPDAVNLSPEDLGAVQQAALAQCALLRNRFCILDVASPDGLAKVDDPQSGFRAKIGAANLDWGAAYGPWLKLMPPVAGDGPAQVPASGGIAGVYAAVDRGQGAWKAPANVSLTGVVGLTEAIDDRTQEKLTTDPSGKAINVVREFPGRGRVVWGARTLAANDNQWRYIPVRRLNLTMEESIRRSTAAVVYEGNDPTTWAKLKATVTKYLYDQWRMGALVGAKPEQAYYVNIGLGQSMNNQDIIEGRLILEYGIAAARPAEFNVLRITYKMQDPSALQAQPAAPRRGKAADGATDHTGQPANR